MASVRIRLLMGGPNAHSVGHVVVEAAEGAAAGYCDVYLDTDELTSPAQLENILRLATETVRSGKFFKTIGGVYGGG